MGNIFPGGSFLKKLIEVGINLIQQKVCFNGGISKSTKYYDRECT